MSAKVIITADDFGISHEINEGIVQAYRAGALSSASLLVNAEATDEAIELARKNPGLEIGLHLSIVEGLSLRGVESSITDELRYFGDGICLHRHWKPFLIRYLTGRIDFEELEEELDLQMRKFLAHFPEIPFLNSTQHLHLLPRIQPIVLKLAKKHGVKALRIPHTMEDLPPLFATRGLYARALVVLGKRLKSKAERMGIAVPDHFAGFDVSGRLTKEELLIRLDNLGEGTTEIMTHPGLECARLRQGLDWGYRDFQWRDELDGLISPEVRTKFAADEISLVRFSDLHRNGVTS